MVSARTRLPLGYIWTLNPKGQCRGEQRALCGSRPSAMRSRVDRVSGEMISIKVPPLGESIVEATISRWLKREGEAVAAGDTLVELETDKVTVEVPAIKAGVLSKQLRKEGDVVKVDEEIGQLDETAVGAGVTTAATPTAQPAAA